MQHPRWCAAALIAALAGCGAAPTEPLDGPRDASEDASQTDAAAPGDAASDAEVEPDATTADPLVTYTEDREPCRERDPLRHVYFGDLHVHTAWSFDAYAFDVRNDPFDAYRFARGEELMLPPLDAAGEGTVPVRLDRPLDFAAVTDHSEYLGETSTCTTEGSPGYDTSACTTYRRGLVGFALMGSALVAEDPTRPAAFCGEDPAACRTALEGVWAELQRAADEAYDRTDECGFTSFVAYEHTGTPGGSMVHRNVIFRNDRVPEVPISYFEAPRAHELWAQLHATCADTGTGCDVLTIPHNPNLSNGLLFELDYTGATTDDEQRARATERERFEPLMEVFQHKGASECFPGFSADEQCGFEILPAEPCGPAGGTDCTAPIDYLRGVLASGMSEEERLGVNPFHYGVIASTDTHNGTPGNVAEDEFPGHVGLNDDTARDRITSFPTFSPGGLVAVWAVENSRDALFEAMQRRETYGTSGPRIAVRFFGGWDYPDTACTGSELVSIGYEQGVPMGGTLPPRPAAAGAPRFLLLAERDEALLQVAQIVKVWLEASGAPRERVFDVAGDATNGATVSPLTCSTAGPGADSLCGVWTDPEFDPLRPAVYYARAIENPTCRWSRRDCNALPRAVRPDACDDGSMPDAVQERAWTSPVWYRPDA